MQLSAAVLVVIALTLVGCNRDHSVERRLAGGDADAPANAVTIYRDAYGTPQVFAESNSASTLVLVMPSPKIVYFRWRCSSARHRGGLLRCWVQTT